MWHRMKLGACTRFLDKVVHKFKIGRLRKFNRAREIEFNIFNRLDYLYETWHTCSSCSCMATKRFLRLSIFV